MPCGPPQETRVQNAVLVTEAPVVPKPDVNANGAGLLLRGERREKRPDERFLPFKIPRALEVAAKPARPDAGGNRTIGKGGSLVPHGVEGSTQPPSRERSIREASL